MLKKRNLFGSTFGVDPYPGHCKLLFDIYNIQYSPLKQSITKTKVHQILRPYIPGELSSFQAYQFKIVYGLENTEWNNLTVEHAQTLIKEMQDLVPTPTTQNNNPLPNVPSSTQLGEGLQDYEPHHKQASLHNTEYCFCNFRLRKIRALTNATENQQSGRTFRFTSTRQASDS